MYQINDTQIEFILNDISARGVEMESLQQNLLDHVCCIIEQDLEEDGDFESFYQKTIKTFYKDALWEIEEETLQLLIFKNYYTMKKIMIVSGTISVLGFAAGSFFKVMHWPGANLLLIFPILLMCFIFLPILFILKVKEKNATRDKITLGIGTTLGILFCLSVLFKMMHWPGANTMNLSVIMLLIFVFIPVYFFTGIRNTDTKSNTIVTTILLIGVGGMLFALTSLKPSRQVNYSKMNNYLQNEELITRMQRLKTDSSFQNSELTNLSSEIITTCNQIKAMIITEDIGQSNIPKDFESQNLWIEEHGLGDDFIEGKGKDIVLDLNGKIDRYNLLIKDQKRNPITNTIQHTLDHQLTQHSNYNLLALVNQIELFVLVNEKEAISKQ